MPHDSVGEIVSGQIFRRCLERDPERPADLIPGSFLTVDSGYLLGPSVDLSHSRSASLDARLDSR